MDRFRRWLSSGWGKTAARPTPAQWLFWVGMLLIGSYLPLAAQAATNCAVQTDIPQSECLALLELYDNTNGPGWSDAATHRPLLILQDAKRLELQCFITNRGD